MLIRKPQQVEPQPMTMDGAAGVSMRLMVGREHAAPNFAMRLFEVAPGGHTPLHQHNYEHEVLILEGQGHVSGSGGNGSTVNRPVAPGDAVFIAPNELHQFNNTGNQTLKFVCMVPTTHDCGNGSVATPGS